MNVSRERASSRDTYRVTHETPVCARARPTRIARVICGDKESFAGKLHNEPKWKREVNDCDPVASRRRTLLRGARNFFPGKARLSREGYRHVMGATSIRRGFGEPNRRLDVFSFFFSLFQFNRTRRYGNDVSLVGVGAATRRLGTHASRHDNWVARIMCDVKCN